MDAGKIKEIIKKEFGKVVNANYYGLIDRWDQWGKGNVKQFHEYYETQADGRKKKQRLHSMKMAKKVCEDWASHLLNEKSKILATEEKANKFLNGEDGRSGILQEIDFPRNTNMIIEKAFCTGTGAIVLRVKGLKIGMLTKKIKTSPELKIDMVYLDAKYIFPLEVHNGDIKDVVFASTTEDEGETIIYLERHHEEKGEQVIDNVFYKTGKNGTTEKISNPEGIPERVNTGGNTPFFAIVKPNISNPHEDNMGLGCAVFDQAEDILKGIDTAYDNLIKEFILGRKKVMYNKSLLQTVGTDKEGQPINVGPDDTMNQLFYSLPDETSGENAFIKEFNPDLRVGDTTEGIQAFLNYLSFRCGFGSKYYQLKDSGRGIATATQYMGERQELRQHANKHSQIVTSAIVSIIKALLWVAKNYKGEDVEVDSDIVVDLKDGYLISDEEQRAQDLKDIQEGILNKWEYRMRWYGEDEKTAKERAPQMIGDVFNGA